MQLPCSDASGRPWTSWWSTTSSPATASTSPSACWGWVIWLASWWVPLPVWLPPPLGTQMLAPATYHQSLSPLPGVPSAAVMEVAMSPGNMGLEHPSPRDWHLTRSFGTPLRIMDSHKAFGLEGTCRELNAKAALGSRQLCWIQKPPWSKCR